MSMNAIDQSLASSYQKYGRLGTAKRGLKAAGSGVMSLAKKVNKATGGEDLSKYFGQKLAKKFASPENKQYVTQDVSGKDALKSAGKVAATVGALALTKKLGGGNGGGPTSTAKRILAKHKKGGDAKLIDKLK